MPKNLADMTPEERIDEANQIAETMDAAFSANDPPAPGFDPLRDFVAALRDADRQAGYTQAQEDDGNLIRNLTAKREAAQLAACPTCGGEGQQHLHAIEPMSHGIPEEDAWRTCAACNATGKVPKYRRALLLAAEECTRRAGHRDRKIKERVALEFFADFLRTFEPEGME